MMNGYLQSLTSVVKNISIHIHGLTLTYPTDPAFDEMRNNFVVLSASFSTKLVPVSLNWLIN